MNDRFLPNAQAGKGFSSKTDWNAKQLPSVTMWVTHFEVVVERANGYERENKKKCFI